MARAQAQGLEFFFRMMDSPVGGLKLIGDLTLNFHGTEFQKSVWNALLRIPFGETRTYRQIAVELGNPNATRAVGAANGRNPMSIIAPCHRLVGTDGQSHRLRRRP